ncbi:MAG TPA: GNAT family N-acetyltransferase [Mycobacteriales bacterium]
MEVRPGLPGEAGEISALALRSKGHWGYDAAFLEACREDLTIDPAWCDGVRLIVAEEDGVLLGYARIAGGPPTAELAGLFVDPPAIGRGVGGLLLRHALRIAADLGIDTLEIDSDPYAEPFYLYAGAVRTGTSPSTVDPTRLLPHLELPVGRPG